MKSSILNDSVDPERYKKRTLKLVQNEARKKPVPAEERQRALEQFLGAKKDRKEVKIGDHPVRMQRWSDYDALIDTARAENSAGIQKAEGVIAAARSNIITTVKLRTPKYKDDIIVGPCDTDCIVSIHNCVELGQVRVARSTKACAGALVIELKKQRGGYNPVPVFGIVVGESFAGIELEKVFFDGIKPFGSEDTWKYMLPDEFASPVLASLGFHFPAVKKFSGAEAYARTQMPPNQAFVDAIDSLRFAYSVAYRDRLPTGFFLHYDDNKAYDYMEHDPLCGGTQPSVEFAKWVDIMTPDSILVQRKDGRFYRAVEGSQIRTGPRETPPCFGIEEAGTILKISSNGDVAMHVDRFGENRRVYHHTVAQTIGAWPDENEHLLVDRERA